MNRIHLFEFNDQRWLPRFVTGWMTRILHLSHEETEDGRVWAPKVRDLVRRYGEEKIVDLCSGGGGPVLAVVRILEQEHGIHPHLTLTDIIPNLQTAREINEAGNNRVYVTEPINATDVPKDLQGVRTVFSGFHHLRPELAFGLLKNAFDCRQHIFIGETTKRSLRALRVYAPAPFYFFSMTHRISPTKAQRFFTFAVPILPFLLGWDNLVSCLRTYSRREIMGFISQLQSDDYRWEVGELWNSALDTAYPYIMGYPVPKSEG
jgi:hypothetical protein